MGFRRRRPDGFTDLDTLVLAVSDTPSVLLTTDAVRRVIDETATRHGGYVDAAQEFTRRSDAGGAARHRADCAWKWAKRTVQQVAT